MRVILAGIIGRYPWGGVTWCSLMYLLGLRKLGHDVFYLEDTCESNFDPEINGLAVDPRYALRHIHESLEPFGFGDRWCYVDYTGKHHGIDAAQWEEICRSADVFLVLSGGCWVWRDHYCSIPVKAFIDSDPGFTQLAIDRAARAAAEDEKKNWYINFFKTYDRHFTFGSAIGTKRCNLPTGEFQWLPTWQPICTDLWNEADDPLSRRNVWTTVMTWQIESFTDIGGNKNEEFMKVLPLAEWCGSNGGPSLELAVNGPREFLGEHGWRCVDAFTISSDLWRYRNYIASSRAEFSVAKHTYVNTRCGWFSDRTECYLASGRPAVVQDTGFGAVLPVGKGLLSWTTMDEAFEAIQSVEKDYGVHCRSARSVALDVFDDRKVLSSLLDRL